MMQKLSKQVKAYKQELGIVMSPEDAQGTGLLGREYSGITTTIGDLQAKKISTNPDMAALLVRLLKEAGVREGDRIAASLSGSFPGLNLALFSAAEVLDLDLNYISSIGSSMYGANEEELTFPEIAYYLYRDGLISWPPLAISMGGDRDMGDEMLAKARELVRERVQRLPVYYLEEGDFQKNLEERLALYSKDGEPAAFVSVGGHTTSLGHDERALDLGQGVLLSRGEKLSPFAAWKTKKSEKTGLIQHYLAEGTAVIHLLNIKKLAFEYGLTANACEKEQNIGRAKVYYTRSYSKPLSLMGIVLTGLPVILYGKRRRAGIERYS